MMAGTRGESILELFDERMQALLRGLRQHRFEFDDEVACRVFSARRKTRAGDAQGAGVGDAGFEVVATVDRVADALAAIARGGIDVVQVTLARR